MIFLYSKVTNNLKTNQNSGSGRYYEMKVVYDT